jgi:flagellar protein FliL
MSNEVANIPEGEGKPAKKKLAGKTLILFIVLPAILLLGGGGAAAYFLVFKKKPVAEADAHGAPAEDGHGAKKEEAGGHGEKKEEKGGHGEKKEEKGGHGAKKEEGGGHGGGAAEPKEGDLKMAAGPNGEIFMTMPDILVNITTADNRPIFLKLKLTLQAKNQEVADTISPMLPKIKDQYTGFLRELRMEDLAGSAGYSRLQLELLKRVNMAVAPAQIDAVFIEEMLVQ